MATGRQRLPSAEVHREGGGPRRGHLGEPPVKGAETLSGRGGGRRLEMWRLMRFAPRAMDS